MEWNKLEDEATLEQLKTASHEYPVVIFKHSTRCSISKMVLDRLERSWQQEEVKSVKPYFLDLIANRSTSTKAAALFNVIHESPQLLLIQDGACTYNASHGSISFDDLKKAVEEGVRE